MAIAQLDLTKRAGRLRRSSGELLSLCTLYIAVLGTAPGSRIARSERVWIKVRLEHPLVFIMIRCIWLEDLPVVLCAPNKCRRQFWPRMTSGPILKT